MHEVRLRLVEGRDIPSIGDIYREAVRFGSASFELDPPDDAEMTRRMRSLVDGGFPYLVATRGYEILGYAYAGPYRARPAYRFTLEDSVYVAAHAQGIGLGRRLLATLIAESEKRGFRQMIAIIGDSANGASVALHQRAGFRHTGTIEAVGWKHGRWLDTVLMQRTLGEGRETPPAE